MWPELNPATGLTEMSMMHALLSRARKAGGPWNTRGIQPVSLAPPEPARAKTFQIDRER